MKQFQYIILSLCVLVFSCSGMTAFGQVEPPLTSESDMAEFRRLEIEYAEGKSLPEEALTFMAYVMANDGRADEGIAFFEKEFEAGHISKTGENYYNWGMLLIGENRYDLAVAPFRNAVEHGYGRYHRNLAQALAIIEYESETPDCDGFQTEIVDLIEIGYNPDDGWDMVGTCYTLQSRRMMQTTGLCPKKKGKKPKNIPDDVLASVAHGISALKKIRPSFYKYDETQEFISTLTKSHVIGRFVCTPVIDDPM